MDTIENGGAPDGGASPVDFMNAFNAFLSEYPGTQRELLAALEESWIPQLLRQGAAQRASAAAAIRRKVKSKKLAEQGEALVAKLFDESLDD